MVPVSDHGGPLAFHFATGGSPGYSLDGTWRQHRWQGAGLVCRACPAATAHDDGLSIRRMDFIFMSAFLPLYPITLSI
jgi:hypothetical protein